MIIFIAISILLAFLLGYRLGKHYGRKLGYHEAEVVIPLRIRQHSLEIGKCIICDEFWTKTSNYENFSRDLDTL